VAHQVGGNPNLAGAILLSGDSYNVGKTGDPILDLAVHVDAFANPTPYGLGGAGAPGVAAGPKQPPVVFGPPDVGGPNINNGAVLADGVNTAWVASNPEQVQYVLAVEDGLFSAVCDNVVPVYGGIGFPPGVATFADLKATGAQTQTVEVPVKAGQFFCYAHEGVSGNRFRVSGR
jgi:hypothetical protein